MIDPNWLYAVAGSAAVFDVIVGAFCIRLRPAGHSTPTFRSW